MKNINKIILSLATLSFVCTHIDLNATPLSNGKRTAPTEQADKPDDGREKKHAPAAQEDNGFTCNICMDDEQNANKELRTTDCGHTFHRECLNGWRLRCESLHRPATCPLCRASLDEQAAAPQHNQPRRQRQTATYHQNDLALILSTQQPSTDAYPDEYTQWLEQTLADQERYYAENIDLQLSNEITANVDAEYIRTLCNDPRVTPRGISFALQFAAQEGRTDLVNIILPNPKTTAYAMGEALWAASCFGHIDIVRILLAKPEIAADAVADALEGNPERVNLDVTNLLLADHRMTDAAINKELIEAVESEQDTFGILIRLLRTGKITVPTAQKALVYARSYYKPDFIETLEAWLANHAQNH